MSRILLAALFATLAITPSNAREFGGYECSDDCSGHAAGYRWAEEHQITDPANCPAEKSQSFYEGCLVYVDDPDRGADEDDDGEEIE